MKAMVSVSHHMTFFLIQVKPGIRSHQSALKRQYVVVPPVGRQQGEWGSGSPLNAVTKDLT